MFCGDFRICIILISTESAQPKQEIQSLDTSHLITFYKTKRKEKNGYHRFSGFKVSHYRLLYLFSRITSWKRNAPVSYVKESFGVLVQLKADSVRQERVSEQCLMSGL